MKETTGSNDGSWRLVPAPAPAAAPVQGAAENLGLCRGLRAERNNQFRCDACGRMRPNGSWLVWVPDSVRKNDPDWSVTEASRLNAFNGHLSGWCLACAKSLSPRPPGFASLIQRVRRWWSRSTPA